MNIVYFSIASQLIVLPAQQIYVYPASETLKELSTELPTEHGKGHANFV